ncbi:MDR family NADP-dependent oxidoreductase [Streptacidiphilus albus]|uniref:MDR family NADP-dependent oxidoreductase n=1 Tax=Streptacidiphilus albus TaxID=105425 RepID=UPI00054BB5C4|nr:NADP-dependent oxidoreductase [Streptacidiphilus albus]
MAVDLPTSSREIRLAAVPEGLPEPQHFRLVETPLPVAGPGEVLVRNRWFQVVAALRTLIEGGVEGTPFTALRPGDTLYGPAIGEVVAAPADSGLRPGELVSHWLGWREYAAVPLASAVPLGDVLPDPVAHLAQGWVAYVALTQGLRVRPADTVFVSGAAGAVGTMAGQLARLLGAGRVVGSAGTREKADRLVAELGYDAVVVRGAGPMAEQLAKAAPEGIDVMLDNVGGEQLQAAVGLARPHARFVLVGALSGQLAVEPRGRDGGMLAPVELDSFQLIIKRITLSSVSGQDVPELLPEWNERFGGWLRSGEIRFPQVRIPGIDGAARALHEVLAGSHFGTVVVEL